MLFNKKNSSEIGKYLNEICNYDILTDEQSMEHIIKYKEKGDIDSRELLICSNLRLVVSVAKSFPCYGNCDLMEMIQEGTIGLMKGLEDYDYTKGNKLSTYITWWIRQRISKYLSINRSDVRVATTMQKKITDVKNCYYENMGEKGTNLTTKEVAERLGYKESIVIDALVTDRITNTISIEDDVQNEKTLLDRQQSTLAILANKNAPNPSEVMAIEEEKFEFDELMFVTLNPREESVLRYRFGFDDGIELTLEDTARILGVTRERVQQIEKKAIEKMKQRLSSKKINSFQEYYSSL
ncbi:sigma-70 family RNA polymerase sigma factor [Bacillus paranthracis]|uniref:sigma-70 family RNA polymerase sigma factor n=1 Tax=Bacillus cereus group TaxID=86661 RepID=UPI001443D6DD|nr:sigma-70 family RNA polymerase sigma factor [Bacillus paranthracis]NKX27162.1 sigma-70 family RNA polymerase sigma factor [Bacillus paranthracis]